jgi:hypothetical protein
MLDSGHHEAVATPRPAVSSRALAGLFAVAVAARAAFLLLEPPTRLLADERLWVALASDLSAPESAFSPLAWSQLFHPPLYAYFLAGAQTLTGSLDGARWIQAALGASLAPLVARLGGALGTPREGLAAGLAAALYPELVWYAAHFWSETLFTVLLWAALAGLVGAARPRPAALAAAGILWGFAALARETVLFLAPVVVLWLAWPRTRRAAKDAALFAFACLLAVLPWTARNHALTGALVPVATRGSFNLWLGNTPAERWGDVYAEYHAVDGGAVAQERHARVRTWEAIVARQPSWLFEKLAREMPSFWGVNDHLVVHVQRGAYRIPLAGRWLLVAPTVLAYLAVLVFAVPSVVPAARERGFTLLLGLLAIYLAMHVVAFGSTRFRLPFLPLLFLLAARTLRRGWRTAWRAQRPAERAASALVAAALAASAAVSIRETFTHPVFRDGRAPAATPSRAGMPLVPAAAARAGGGAERRET